MPLLSNLKPLISDRKSGVAVGLQVASLQGTDPQQFQAWNTVQNAINDIYRQMTSSPTLEQLTVVDASGNVLAEIGDFTVGGVSYSGAAFAQVYIGPNADPSTAPFFSDGQHVVIGKNGIVEVQDMGGNVDATLGVTEESPLAISAATNASPSVVTIAGHGYINGDTIVVAGATGNTAINGYRIIANVTTNTFTMTDLSGTQINGNGAYGGSGTAARYYAGILAQTFATGPSFANYRFRAFADGSLKIHNADFELDGGGTSLILHNTSDYGVVYAAACYNTSDGSDAVIIAPGVINLLSNITAGINRVWISGTGAIHLYDNFGTTTTALSSLFGLQLFSGGVDITGSGGVSVVTGVYSRNGVPGMSSSFNVGTSLTVTTASAITGVTGPGISTNSATFVTGVTLNLTPHTASGGILTV